MNITQLKAALPRELLASVVVFLVALPLCLGIALASGAPLFAGVMALADQAAGAPHGFANPALYGASASAFHDVAGNPLSAGVVRVDYVNGENAADGTSTTLRTLNDTGTIKVRPGYDDVTGRGTPNGSTFLDALK